MAEQDVIATRESSKFPALDHCTQKKLYSLYPRQDFNDTTSTCTSMTLHIIIIILQQTFFVYRCLVNLLIWLQRNRLGLSMVYYCLIFSKLDNS